MTNALNNEPQNSPSNQIFLDQELRIQAKRSGKNGRFDVTAKLGGRVIHCDKITPSKAADRRCFAKALVDSIGESPTVTLKAVEEELLTVATKISELATKSAEEAVPLSDIEEIDTSRVVRPELILHRDVSAIAIPRMVQSGNQTIGEWLHYVRQGDSRSVSRLGSDLTKADGERLWLSPIPPTPQTLDVKRWNVWSSASRKAWLNGTSSPTTAEVLRMVAERIDRYVVLPADAAEGHALTLAAWVLMTYAYPALPAIPYLYLAGPPNSGKTRAMDVLSRMVYRPTMTSNATAPTIFRGRHAFGGTILFDEAERMRESRSPEVAELSSIFLAGYRRGGSASRLEPAGDSYRWVSFDCYGPVVFGCIRGLPPALASRCITVRMIRAAEGDPQAKRSLDDSPTQEGAVRDALHCWAMDHASRVVTAAVDLGSLSNRNAELWGPLLRITADAGDDAALNVLADHAAVTAKAAAEDSEPEHDELLIMSLYQLRNEGKMPTAAEILERARSIDAESMDDGWVPRMVAGKVRRYFVPSKSNGKKIYRQSPSKIVELAKRYSFDVEGGAQ